MDAWSPYAGHSRSSNQLRSRIVSRRGSRIERDDLVEQLRAAAGGRRWARPGTRPRPRRPAGRGGPSGLREPSGRLAKAASRSDTPSVPRAKRWKSGPIRLSWQHGECRLPALVASDPCHEALLAQRDVVAVLGGRVGLPEPEESGCVTADAVDVSDLPETDVAQVAHRPCLGLRAVEIPTLGPGPGRLSVHLAGVDVVERGEQGEQVLGGECVSAEKGARGLGRVDLATRGGGVEQGAEGPRTRGGSPRSRTTGRRGAPPRSRCPSRSIRARSASLTAASAATTAARSSSVARCWAIRTSASTRSLVIGSWWQRFRDARWRSLLNHRGRVGEGERRNRRGLGLSKPWSRCRTAGVSRRSLALAPKNHRGRVGEGGDPPWVELVETLVSVSWQGFRDARCARSSTTGSGRRGVSGG